MKFRNTVLSYFLPHFFIALWAGLTFVFTNRYEFFYLPSVLYFYTGIFLISAVLTLLGFRLFPNHKHQVAICAHIGLFIMFLTPAFRELLDPFIPYRYTLAISLFLFAGGCLAAVKYSRVEVVSRLSILFLLMATVPGSQLIYFNVFQGAKAATVPVPLKGPAVIRPNVYFFILDAHMRSDKLKEVLGYDNSAFLSFLHNKDFFIADKSYSAYPGTNYSIVTTLRMNYAAEYEPKIRTSRFDGAVFDNFRKLGYRVFYVPHARSLGTCPDQVTCFHHQAKSDSVSIGRLGITLIKTIPLLEEAITKVAPDLYDYAANEITDLDQALGSFDASAPAFFYGHIEMPHPPYLRDADCQPVDYKLSGGIDGYEWSERSRYLGFMKCGNRQVMVMIDSLIAKDPSSIIIIESDHGSYFINFRNSGDTGNPVPGEEPWKVAAMEEAYAVLGAYRVPDSCRNMLYPSISPVNTFRMVFACLTRTKTDYLPDQSFAIDGRNKSLGLIRDDGRWLF